MTLDDAGLSAAEAALLNGLPGGPTTNELKQEMARKCVEAYFDAVEVDTKRRLHPEDRSQSISGVTKKFWVGGVEGYITTNCFPDGSLGEIFIHGVGKEGSTVAGFMDLAAIFMSIGLQYGVPLEQFTKFMIGMEFEPKDEEYKSIPDHIGRYLRKKYGKGQSSTER